MKKPARRKAVSAWAFVEADGGIIAVTSHMHTAEWWRKLGRKTEELIRITPELRAQRAVVRAAVALEAWDRTDRHIRGNKNRSERHADFRRAVSRYLRAKGMKF